MPINCLQSVHGKAAHTINVQESNVPVSALPLSMPLTICACSMGRQPQGTMQQQQLWLLHAEFEHGTHHNLVHTETCISECR